MHISRPSEDEILLEIPDSLEEVKLLLASRPEVFRPSDHSFEDWIYKEVAARNPYSGDLFGIMIDVLYNNDLDEGIVWGVIEYRQEKLGHYHQHSENGEYAYDEWMMFLTTP
jgi:hypothetical protein